MTLVTIELVDVSCGAQGCNIIFGLERNHYDRLHRSHETFFCPAGHRRCWPGESDIERAERLKREADQNAAYWRDRSIAERADAKRSERRVLAYQGHLGKLRKRIANGVCPCCKRTFSNVARHIANQHPDFGGAEFVMPRPDEKIETPKQIRSSAKEPVK